MQTERLRWHTDDLLIIGQNGAGTRRNLPAQVKRTFTVSATDRACARAIEDFWSDFTNDGGPFSSATDRFALVTLRGTDNLLRHFDGLLTCARAARDGEEFAQRLATKGLISQKAVRYCAELRDIVGSIEGRSIPDVEIWSFLRCLHILSLDLHTPTRQTEAAIKTLLAHTAAGLHASTTADASWNELLAIASDAMTTARSFGRNDLPESLRHRHSPVGRPEHRVLEALKDHTDIVLKGIRSTIGRDYHLPRTDLVQKVLRHLESTQVVLVSGPSGIGKSAVIKDAIAVLAGDHFVLAFRAEEFALPHLDATFQNAQIPANAGAVRAILAGQHRKILLVESVERLLEKSTRDAFSDLLKLADDDESLRILLTCRDYSTELVRAALLPSTRLASSVVVVPELNEVELKEVTASLPTLARPLQNPALRRLLRNPYFLDKASQISWSADRPLPESERDFRDVFWKQIIRGEARSALGVPDLRDGVFREIAVRRAQALAPYVTCADLDASAVDTFRHDSLIASSDQSASLVAPAHDVLEDWAILRWIEQRYLASNGSFRAFSDAIGTHPAVRRAYRMWVTELVDHDRAAAHWLFAAVVADPGISARFRDDTLVSLLRAPSSPAFLQSQVTKLLANDRALLKRVIHLLRVACMAAPTWLPAEARHGTRLNVPDGPAWASVLTIVQNHVQAFTGAERPLLLGLITDWASGVAWWAPYPPGAESVFAIAHRLLPTLDTYSSESAGRQTLTIIAKLPRVDPASFEALLRGVGEEDWRDPMADDLRDIVFTGVEGMPAARDFPDLVISVASDSLLCSEDDVRGDGYRVSSLELEPLFGLKRRWHHKCFPPSAYRGPWLPLLRHHPNKTLTFFIGVFNHSVDWYAHPRIPDRVESPFEIELAFADGTLQRQWASSRLWQWYRGTSVGPDVLQCMLMALERWLFDSVQTRRRDLDAILLDLLRRSHSAALAGVAASVATAFPHSCGETLLVLLSSPTCIWLDRDRMVMESDSPSRLPRFLVGHGEDAGYETERKEADGLPHRRRDLETAIANLQLGPLADRVHQILDRHRAALPPASEQTDGDRVWRLSMHRMDLRRYSVAGADATNTEDATDSGSGRPAAQVRLEADEPEPDIMAMVERSTSGFRVMDARLRLLMWAFHVFRNREVETYDPAVWRQQLDLARAPEISNPDSDERDLGRGGPGNVAAVCVRDHWSELSQKERDWCLDVICSEIERHAGVWHLGVRIQRHDQSADRPCAFVAPLLLEGPLSSGQQARVRRAFIAALTHPVQEVQSYAVWGVAEQLWSKDRQLVMRCVNALATQAILVDEAQSAEAERPYGRRRQTDDLQGEAASAVRERFWNVGEFTEDAYQRLDIAKRYGADANRRILVILGQEPDDPQAVGAFARTAQTLVEWWMSDRDHRGGHRERNHETESAISELLQSFVMRTSGEAARTVIQPLLDAVDAHPSEVHWTIRGLTDVEAGEPNTPQFWFLWGLFADSLKGAKWLVGMKDSDRPYGKEMISAIFLNSSWRDGVSHWKSLEGHAHHVHALFDDLPPSSTVLDAYVRFLYHIGERSLPPALVHIATRLQAGDAQRMLRETNTVFMLEVLLQRQVYGRPLELKRDRPIRDAVLYLLDTLVEQGSSASFRMRDDFVTPVSAT